MEINDNTNLKSGPFSIYPALGQIEVKGQVLRLGPVNMKVLLCLLQGHGQVISRAHLFANVWKNQSISDDTLTRCISDIRSKLGGGYSTKQGLIATVPKKGYRWLLEVTPLSENPKRHKNKIATTVLITLLASFMGLLALSVLSMKFIQYYLSPKDTPIALLSMRVIPPLQQSIGNEIDEILRELLLNTSQLKLLSNSAMNRSKHPTFHFLSSDFNVQWLIEGKVYKNHNQWVVSYSLIDVRTSLVRFSDNRKFDNNLKGLKQFSQNFIEKIKVIIQRNSV